MALLFRFNPLMHAKNQKAVEQGGRQREFAAKEEERSKELVAKEEELSTQLAAKE
jgi:hypothetical protein